jgi:hypothetical protein
MTLAANTRQKFFSGDTALYPVEAEAEIFEGAAVGDNGSGYIEPLTAGKSFRGFAKEYALGTATNGETKVLVQRRGALTLAISSLAIDDVGKTVYASDDGTFTLSAQGTTANTKIGRVIQFVSTGYGIVEFDLKDNSEPYEVVAAGEYTTTNQTAEAITVAGVLATDLAFATLLVVGSTPRTILTTIASANTLTVTFSGATSTDHQISYVVLRAKK